MEPYTSKISAKEKSYIEHPSSIEVTLILPFDFVLNKRVSLNFVGGRYFEEDEIFNQNFWS